MFTLLNELHFWTIRSEISIRDTDFGSFCYYEKRSHLDNKLLLGKKSYSEQRGIVWCPSNKRPAKLRDSIKELEEYLESSSVIFSQWKEPDYLMVILGSGLLISIKINILTGDLEQIHFDKHLLSKLSSEHVSDVAVGGSEAVFALDGGRVLAVHYAKSALKSSSKHWVTVDSRANELVSSSNQQNGSLRLRLSSNSTVDKVAVWWAKKAEPWEYTSQPTSFPPIHIYHFSNLRLEPACCLRTESFPVLVAFSHLRPYILHIIVQIISPREEVWLGWCQMDISSLRGDRGVTVQPHRTVELHSHVAAVALSPAEDKLLIACLDSTLLVADYAFDYVVTNKTCLEGVTVVAWHPDSCILVAGDNKARIQFFDSSLSPIRAQFATDQYSPNLHLDIGAYFRHQPTLLNMSWNRKLTKCSSSLQIDAFLFFHFERGPLGVLKLIGGSRPGFPVDSVVCHYLAEGGIDRAVSLLSSLSWDFAGSVALACLQSIVNYLLKKPLTRERHDLLDKAIESYLDSKRPISRVTCMEFNDSVTDIRRKIFHHLLRYQVYDDALKLAADLGHYDLLMDIHNLAKANGSQQLANTALEKAEQISEYSTTHSHSSLSSHSSYESSCSWCSRSSCSQCKEEEDQQKKHNKTAKEEKKNVGDKARPNGKVKNIETKCSLEESSSQASSKTSLLRHNCAEEAKNHDKIYSQLSNNNNNSERKPQKIIQNDSCKNVSSSIDRLNSGDSEEPHRNEETACNGETLQPDRPIDEVLQEFNNCVKIDINDDEDENTTINDLIECKNNNLPEVNDNRSYLNGTIPDINSDIDCESQFKNNSTDDCRRINDCLEVNRDQTYVNGVRRMFLSGVAKSNGLQLFKGNEPERDLQKNYYRTDKALVNSSSLWGKDRVHVQSLVGDQWTGSLVRVPVGKWSNLNNSESPLSVLQKRDNESAKYPPAVEDKAYSGIRKPFNDRPMTSKQSVDGDSLWNDSRNNRWIDPNATGNMCDLQKESYRANDFNDSTFESNPNNWSEPAFMRDPLSDRSTYNEYGWNAQYGPPPPSRNVDTRWKSSNLDENDCLYEQMPSSTLNGNEWIERPIPLNPWSSMDLDTSPAMRVIDSNGRWLNSTGLPEFPPPDLPPARVGPNLWINSSSDRHSGIFWPKPYLGPRERPPPPPPPRPRVQFAENVTHITLPPMNGNHPPVEGNFNTVGLPDADMSGYTSHRRLNPTNKTLDPIATYPTQISNNQGGSSNENIEDTSKVKVVHFGLV